jgi:hypothetical protein
MLDQTSIVCELCKCETKTWERHHVVPKCEGGRHGETIKVCKTCGGQVHMLFTEKELSIMTIAQLKDHRRMKSYLKWKKKHPGDYRHKTSNRIKKR